MEENIYTWILVRKENSVCCNKHRQIEKPKLGNNGKETDISDIFVWIEWNKPLPDDIDEKEYTLDELNSAID